jgi:hypothetical protein
MPSAADINCSQPEEAPLGHQVRKNSTPTPNGRSKSTMQGLIHLVSPEPSDDPCCHEIHPAYSLRYNYPCCPECRLYHSISELKILEERIKTRYDGAITWRQRIIECTDPVKRYNADILWTRLLRGRDRMHPENAYTDDYGKDWSLRHVKKRLHNMLDEVGNLADQEAQWARENIAGDENLTPRPATAVLQSYYRLLYTGKLDYLQAYDAYFARLRGREWEISLDPNYPEDLSELAHHYLKTPEQRAFINSSTVSLAQQQEYFVMPRSKTRRSGAKVTFAPQVFVRSEADIDVLRKQNLSSSNIARKLFSRLRGLFAKPSVEIRDLSDGPCRAHICYLRPYNVGGSWGAPKGSVTVDTSGDRFKRDYGSWEEYGKKLHDEAKDEDAEKPDLRAAFEALIVFVIVWGFLFFTCTLAGPRRVVRGFFSSGGRSQDHDES